MDETIAHKSATHKAVLSLGSNCGDRETNVTNVLTELSGMFGDMRNSGIYETPEIHGKGAPYMNAVVECAVSLDFDRFNALVKEMELRNGRTAQARARGEVPIDIDVVIWDCSVIRPADFSREFFQIGYRRILSAEDRVLSEVGGPAVEEDPDGEVDHVRYLHCDEGGCEAVDGK